MYQIPDDYYTTHLAKRTSCSSTRMFALHHLVILLYITLVTATSSSFDQSSSPKCANKFDIEYHTVDNFTNHMCNYCLSTMIQDKKGLPTWKNLTLVNQWEFDMFANGDEITLDGKVIYQMRFDRLKVAIGNNDTENDLVLGQFADRFYMDTFMKCCEDAHKCCQRMLLADQIEGQCPMQWDGWQCWESSPPGDAVAPCPDMAVYLLGFLPKTCTRETVAKQCDANGQWHKIWNPYYHRWLVQTKNNGNQCFYVARGIRSTATNMVVILSIASLVCTIIGLILFTFYKLYSQFRMQIHLNFFISIILSTVATIQFELLVARAHLDNKNTQVLDNHVACRTLKFIQKDTRLVNLFWMLLEGFNFHSMVVFPFNDLSKYKVVFYLFGYLAPHLFMLADTLVRMQLSNDNCWQAPIGIWEFIYVAPAYVCFIINLALFINLLRVIVVKLVLPKSHHYHNFVKRGVKTSLVLLPIFGIQYIVEGIPVDPTDTCSTFIRALYYLIAFIEGSQGIIITTALCFLNKEVYSCVRKSISSMDTSSILTASNTLSDDSRRSS